MNFSCRTTSLMKKCLSSHDHLNVLSEVTCFSKDQHFIITNNDMIIFSCDIPIESPDKIICEDFGEDCVVLLSSINNGCCVVSLSKRETIEYFPKAKDVFIDDYVNIGHDQIIFLFQDGSETDFYVTDYACCNFDTRQEICCNNEGSSPDNVIVSDESDGYNSAVASLEKQLLVTTSVLQNEKARLAEKENLIRDSLEALVLSSLGVNDSNNSSEHLVDLLNDAEHSSPSVVKPTSSNDNATLELLDSWCRVHNDQLVVGVEIKNVSDDKLSCLSLSILSNSNVSSSSQVEFITGFEKKDNQSRKLQKLETGSIKKGYFHPKDKCLLTTVTELSCMALSCIEFHLQVHYVTSNSSRHSVYLGKKRLTNSDITSGSLAVARDVSSRDSASKIAVDVTSSKQHFAIVSNMLPLTLVEKTIAKRLSCECEQEGNISILKPIHLNSEIRLSNSFSNCYCTVYAKSHRELMIVMGEIETCLPASVAIEYRFDKMAHFLKELHFSLKDEIECSINYTKNMLLSIEEECDREKEIIVIDAPKKRKNVDESEKNMMAKVFHSSVIATNKALIALEANI